MLNSCVSSYNVRSECLNLTAIKFIHIIISILGMLDTMGYSKNSRMLILFSPFKGCALSCIKNEKQDNPMCCVVHTQVRACNFFPCASAL